MPPVLLDTDDLASVMSDAVRLASWTEEQCDRWDVTAKTLAQPGAEVRPAVVVDLIRTMQQGQRLAAGHAILTAATLTGAAERAEREARPKGWRERVKARIRRALD